jgi:alkylation response protein AidB-like acyl-CoA dehydrogenase
MTSQIDSHGITSLSVTEEHQELAQVAASMVATRAGLDGARRVLLEPAGAENRWWETDGLWKEIVATGWLGLHIEERYGGQGYGQPELAIVLEQLGRYALAGPFLPTVVAAAVIAEAGTDEQRSSWLPRLVSGDVVAGVGVHGASSVSRSALSCTGVVVLGEPAADVVLIPVGEDLVLVEAGAAVQIERNCEVDRLTAPVSVVDAVSAPVAEVLSGAASVAVRLLGLFAAAEAIGGMAACTEMATAYAATREQFGRPIGSFQAVKHHCSNMLVDSAVATAAVWDAARATGAEAEIAATMAAGQVLHSYQRVAQLNIQVHGGIAYTWEHDAHLYLRRAAVLLALAGGVDIHERATHLHLAGARREKTLELPPSGDRLSDAVREFRRELDDAGPGERATLWAHSGYLLPQLPEPYGKSAGPAEQLVIERELRGVQRPELGLGEWILPTLLRHGTAEQIERLMWPSLEGHLRWCQLFSEPGAGSDAAAVSTKAVRVDGGWSVTGQKVWTSDAMNCQRGLLTVRTDPDAPKHKGITAMIVDMTAAGVEVRPLKELTGEALFNEVFFDAAFVPDGDVVGAVNSGWEVVMATFGNERVSIGGGSVTMTAPDLTQIFVRHRGDDRSMARGVGALLAEDYAVGAFNLRQAARAVLGDGSGIEGNIAKLFGTEHAQRVAQLGMQLAGPAVLAGAEPTAVHDYLYSRCLTIAGGTSEIVRNLISERILGLPREPARR